MKQRNTLTGLVETLIRHVTLLAVLFATVGSSLAETPKYVTYGDDKQNARFGSCITTLDRDINADSVKDFIVGAPGDVPSSSPFNQGTAFEISGANGNVVSRLRSSSPNHYLGTSCASGDIDNDGYRDFIVASDPSSSDSSQYVRVYSGATLTVVATLTHPNPSAGNTYGRHTDVLGDVNNDGYLDIIVADPNDSSCDSASGLEGKIYVYSGANWSTLYAICGPTGLAGRELGYGVGGVGDVNADGYSDFAAGVSSNPSSSANGEIRIYSGQTGSVLYTLSNMNVGPSMIIPLGDVSGDSVDDFAVSAFTNPGGTGLRAYVRAVSGQSGSTLYEITDSELIFNLAEINRLNDINGDGKSDLFYSGRNRARIHSGASGAVLAELNYESPFNSNDSSAPLGDVTSDGYVDFAIGQSAFNNGSQFNVGRVRVFGYDQFQQYSCQAGGTLFLQNQTETGVRMYNARDLIAAGTEVTSAPFGDYVVSGSSADVKLVTSGTINLAPGFSVVSGAKFAARYDANACP